MIRTTTAAGWVVMSIALSTMTSPILYFFIGNAVVAVGFAIGVIAAIIFQIDNNYDLKKHERMSFREFADKACTEGSTHGNTREPSETEADPPPTKVLCDQIIELEIEFKKLQSYCEELTGSIKAAHYKIEQLKTVPSKPPSSPKITSVFSESYLRFLEDDAEFIANLCIKLKDIPMGKNEQKEIIDSIWALRKHYLSHIRIDQ